jgi:nucleoside-diphosphate-sugar epimerase
VKILITGATGFIGSAFTRLALERGHEVGGLILPGERIPASLPNHNGLHWFCGTMQEAPWGAIREFAPECCIHSAWITTPGVYLEAPENVMFRDASLVFLRKAVDAGARHIFGIGTCIEYRITSEPLHELRTPVDPTTLYARCKNDLHRALEEEAATRGFDFCWGRVFYPYGPGEHPSRLCSSIISRLRQSEPIELKTPASQKDYIYIDDLAAAWLAVVEKRAAGPVNLGTGQGIAVREIAQTLATLLEKPDLVRDAPNPTPDAFPYVVADADRLKSLGWQPRTNLRQGLERLIRGIA